MTDAAEHSAAKSFFYKLGSSQANHFFQILDQLTDFLPKKDLHELSADLCLQFQFSCASTWSQLLRLNNVINRWAMWEFQPNIATDLTRNFQAVFNRIRKTRLQQKVENIFFGVRQFEFLGRTILSEGVGTQFNRNQNFLNKPRFPKSREALQHFLVSVKYSTNYITKLTENVQTVLQDIECRNTDQHDVRNQ